MVADLYALKAKDVKIYICKSVAYSYFQFGSGRKRIMLAHANIKYIVHIYVAMFNPHSTGIGMM